MLKLLLFTEQSLPEHHKSARALKLLAVVLALGLYDHVTLKLYNQRGVTCQWHARRASSRRHIHLSTVAGGASIA